MPSFIIVGYVWEIFLDPPSVSSPKKAHHSRVKNFLHFYVIFLVGSQFAGTTRYDLNYKHSNFFKLQKIVFNILYITFFLELLFYATSTFVCFSPIWSRFKYIISKTKLNHVNIKAMRVVHLLGIDKYIVSFFVDNKGLKLSLLN